MAEIQKLRHPPIREALIDFRLNVPEGVGFDALDRLSSDLSGLFPVREEQHQIEFAFGPDAEAGDQSRAKDTVVGYVLRSEDALKAIVLRRNGCSASHVADYSSWEALYKDATNLLERFVRQTGAEAVTRVAARFINHIPLPDGFVDLDELLIHGPKVPDRVKDQLFSYQNQLGIVDDRSGLRAIVRQGLAQDPASAGTTIVIDSDVYKEATFEPSIGALVETLAAIRDLKNRIFFGSVHEKALEPFK
jgi:uncharacterized protein (TIGR04255 family)